MIDESPKRTWNWIAKDPPKYVWAGDVWYCERDKEHYICEIENALWRNKVDGSKTLAFTKGTVLMKETNE